MKKIDKTYVMRKENGKTVYLHRFIMGTPKGMVTDHINGNTLDNRRKNLRVCTKSENNRNRAGDRNTSSKYKGVSFHKRSRLWHAYINLNGKRKSLGTHKTEKKAAEDDQMSRPATPALAVTSVKVPSPLFW